MKFEEKYPLAKNTDKFEFEYSYLTKDVKLGQCFVCQAFTRWIDGRVQKPFCSEECCTGFWKSQVIDNNLRHKNPILVQESIDLEAAVLATVKPIWKDIIIIVRDQLSYLKICIESIQANTQNYTLYIWDNGSNEETVAYLHQLQKERVLEEAPNWDIEVWRSEQNQGFIKPNNQLVSVGTGEYVILLNSDTKVFQHWDTAMIGWLQCNPSVAQVGYWGGHLGADGRGFGGDNGYNIDYIPGWCFAIHRDTYKQFGLFDESNLDFAYCEDSDFSLRLTETGKKLYALHIPLVYHYSNKTINVVAKEGVVDVRSTFDRNHAYIRTRWQNYLVHNRALLKHKI